MILVLRVSNRSFVEQNLKVYYNTAKVKKRGSIGALDPLEGLINLGAN